MLSEEKSANETQHIINSLPVKVQVFEIDMFLVVNIDRDTKKFDKIYINGVPYQKS